MRYLSKLTRSHPDLAISDIIDTPQHQARRLPAIRRPGHGLLTARVPAFPTGEPARRLTPVRRSAQAACRLR